MSNLFYVCLGNSRLYFLYCLSLVNDDILEKKSWILLGGWSKCSEIQDIDMNSSGELVIDLLKLDNWSTMSLGDKVFCFSYFADIWI